MAATARAQSENAPATDARMVMRRMRCSASCAPSCSAVDGALKLRGELLHVRGVLRRGRLQLGDLLLQELRRIRHGVDFLFGEHRRRGVIDCLDVR